MVCVLLKLPLEVKVSENKFVSVVKILVLVLDDFKVNCFEAIIVKWNTETTPILKTQ